MRLIDADALYEAIEDHVTTVSVCPTAEYARGKTEFKRICLEEIRSAPTIDGMVSADDSDDLISRSAAIAEIEDYIEEYSDVDPETGLHNPKWCAMEEAKDVLIKAPAAPSITGTHVNHGDGSLIDSIDDTITAFRCCVQTPPDCAKCPMQGPGFGFACRQKVKDGVAFWLNRAKESMRK